MQDSKKKVSKKLPMSDDEASIIEYIRKQLIKALPPYQKNRNMDGLSSQNLTTKLHRSDELAKTSLLTFIRIVKHTKKIDPQLNFSELEILTSPIPTEVLKELSELYKDPTYKTFIETVIKAYYNLFKEGNENGKTENAQST